jgi:ABC-type uncharacterized transport system ATPase subunit
VKVALTIGCDWPSAREEIFGFLGPNGPGRTTTAGMLATFDREPGRRLELLTCALRMRCSTG